MFQQSSPDTKIAVLEERLSVYEQMVGRIDIAIQKISETNQGISRMLTIHNERIEQSIRTDDIIVKMIEDIKVSSKEQHDEISKKLGERIEKIEVKVESISKFRWQILGGLAVVAIFIKFIPPALNLFGTSNQTHATQQSQLK